MRVLTWFAQDLRYGLRGLRKDLGFAVLAVLALALGIGASTVIFSVIDNVLLEPFPYRDASRLVGIYIHDNARAGLEGRGDFSIDEYQAFKQQNHGFDGLIASNRKDILYTDKAGTKQFFGAEATTDTFELLGIKALLGRTMIPDDGRPGAPPVAVMSYRVWQTEFNGDPSIVGQALTLNGRQVALVGIMPPRFRYGNPAPGGFAADFWVPLDFTDTSVFHRVYPLGRLKPGVSFAAAEADLDVIAHRLSKASPQDYPANFNAMIRRLADREVGDFRTMLFALMGAVSMLLLIACSNVANLLLARATAREREIGIRASLGATRSRLFLQLIVESFLLALAACAAGCFLAYAGIKGVTLIMPPVLVPPETVISLNVHVLLFCLAAALVATLLCGIAPALHSVRGQIHERLKNSAAGTGPARGQFRSGLVVSQVAFSIVLLVGAGLMMRGLFGLQHVDLGLTPDHILFARAALPSGRYRTAEQKRVFFTQALQQISSFPGVVSATETSTLPPYEGIPTDIALPGKTHAQKWNVIFDLCSPGYFRTLGIRLLRGRLLSEADVEAAHRVIVINQTLARKFFGKEDPIGHSVKFNLFDIAPESPRDAYFEIIGIVADVKNRGIQWSPDPEAFMPYTVSGAFARGFLIRTAVEPLSLVDSVRHEVWSVDPGVALTEVDSLEHFLNRFSYSHPRFGLILLAAFASIGLALAAIGVFSVLAYSVSLQTHEIGIRMALGAQQSAVLRMVMKRGLTLVAIGIVVGELASLALTRFIRSQLWYVSPHDPVTFAAVLGVLVTVGLAACIVPAHRATQVDPLVALRHE